MKKSLLTCLAGAPGLLSLLSLLFFLLQAWCLWQAPAAWYPAAVSVKLAPGDSVTLGRRELAAPQADSNHIVLRRDLEGAWWLRNVSAAKQVLLQTAHGEQRIGSVTLRTGQQFQVGGARFDVSAADTGSVVFRRDGQSWRYDGATLYRDGQAQEACADARLASRLLMRWNRNAPSFADIARPLTFGGNVHCGNRLGLAGVTPGAVTMTRQDGRLQLAAGTVDGERAALLVSVDGASSDVRQHEQNLAGVTALVVGHTRFQLAPQAGQLTLLPARRVTLYSAPAAELPPQVAWQWRARDLWSAPGQQGLWAGLALALALMAATATVPVRAAPWRLGLGAGAALTLLVCGVTALVMQRGGHAPAAAYSMSLGGAALALWLVLPGRLPLALGAALVLMACGLLLQLEMGLGGMESSWLRYYQKSAALLAIGCAVGVSWSLWRAWRWQQRTSAPLPQRGVEWALLALAALALVALAMQVLWGDETGVFDLQPVELAKLVLTVLTAHCLALRLGWHADAASRPGQAGRWLRLIAPALLFLALLGLALVQVDDYSPLILLLVWTCAMALAYALAARNRALAIGVALLVVAAIGAIVHLRGMDGAELQGGFYADRFQVWLAPAEHPHTGQQLLLGARAIGDGGWWGASGWLGLPGLGQPVGAVLQIPAVQDDFAPAFFLNRHGLAGALLLWCWQAALITGLLLLALRAFATARQARDYRHAWQARLHYFALCGGAAFVLAHLLLSWGTNLAIFPIMGQPMSFLSAGGSHLLFFLCPLLAFAAPGASSLEESSSCRSMSSTKS